MGRCEGIAGGDRWCNRTARAHNDVVAGDGGFKSERKLSDQVLLLDDVTFAMVADGLRRLDTLC